MNINYFYDTFKYQKRIRSHSECINAIEISPFGDFLASAGDDRKILLTHILSDEFQTKEYLETPHDSSIEYLNYGSETTLYTCGIDGFMCKYDLERSFCSKFYKSSDSCFKVDKEGFDSYLIALSTAEAVIFYDERQGIHPVTQIDFYACKAEFRNNTHEFLVGSMHNYMKMYDFRNINKPLRVYTMDGRSSGISDCKFNSDGSLIIVTQQSFGPSIYSVDSSSKLADCYLPEYRNIVTYKSFRFGGPDDSFVLAGFDNKRVYCWPLKPTKNDNIIKSGFIKHKQFNNDLFEKTIFEKYPVDNFKFENYGKYVELNSNYQKNIVRSTNRIHENSFSISQMIGNNKSMSNLKKTNKYKNSFILSDFMTFSGFSSIINIAVMHKTIPLIFCAGVENCIYAISSFNLGKDDEFDPNTDSQLFLQTFIDEVYREM